MMATIWAPTEASEFIGRHIQSGLGVDKIIGSLTTWADGDSFSLPTSNKSLTWPPLPFGILTPIVAGTSL